MRIEIHDRYDSGRRFIGRLALSDDLIVVYRKKSQGPVCLERNLLAANLIYAADQRRQAVGALDVPHANLILFRIQVFLAARPQRLILAELESRAVDSVIRTKCRRQNQPGHERRPAAMLEVVVENVGRIRPQIGTKKFIYASLRQFGEILGELKLCILPSEISVRLRET